MKGLWRAIPGWMAAATVAFTAVSQPVPYRQPDRRGPDGTPLYPSTYRAPPAPPTLVADATILDGAGGRLDHADVLMAGGRIVALGHGLPRPAGTQLIEAHGRWVTPGLIDVHTHLGVYTLPQTSLDADASDVTEVSDPNAADTWIEHAVRPEDPGFGRALAGGVTTLQILPGSSVLFGGRSVIVHPVPAVTVAAMKMPGAPQGLKMACGGNPKEEFGDRHLAPNSRQGEFAILRHAFLIAQEHMQEPQDGSPDRHGPRGGHGPAFGPGDDLKTETLQAALRGELQIHVHCYRSDDMARFIDLSHEFGFRIAAFHHAAEAYKIAPLLVAEGICVAGWPDWWGFKPEAEDGIRENIAIIDAAGGCAMVHSDIPILGDHLTIEAAKAAGSGRRMGLALPPERVIRWVTSNPAKALGLADRIGRLAPGYDADLVVWSGDPFSVYAHPDLVFVDGALRHDRAQPRPSDFELGRTVDEPVR